MVKHLGIKLAILGAAVGSLGGAPDAAAFRAMTWNIRGGPTARSDAPPFDLNAVRTVVERYSPDILALQEVCSWQATTLASSLGYAWHETTIAHFDDPRDAANGHCDYGIALLSKTAIPEQGRYRTDLLAPSEGCKSDATEGSGHPECRVNMGGLLTPLPGLTVRAASAHVGTAREPYLPGLDQSLELDRLVGDAERNEPVALMMGDYNVLPDDPRMTPRMEGLGYQEAGGDAPTFPSGGTFGAPFAKVDYLYYRGLVALGGEIVEPLVDGVEASDHRAVVADFGVRLRV
jgi:endonuclease/exonuclease/phosphatase family metal-dependent hydrolase